jgi:SNF2 family DNA or RNA helicase
MHTFCGFLIFIQLFVVVLCPLNVTNGWISEIVKFSPNLKVLQYVGEKEHRRSLCRAMYEHVKGQSSSYNISL